MSGLIMRSVFVFLLLWTGSWPTPLISQQVPTVKITGVLMSSTGLPLRGQVLLVFDKGKALLVGDGGVLSPSALTNEKGDFALEVDPRLFGLREIVESWKT
jgi:hypothetical protein